MQTQYDPELIQIADYVIDTAINQQTAYDTACLCLQDALGCAILALRYPACTQLLGPLVPETTVANGARVPGTDYILDPQQAAFNLGCMIRWLDFNDTWLAAEWGHPSDNIGGILSVADYVTRRQLQQLTVHDVLTAIIKAYEIQGILALENAFNRVGLDHVILVKVATTAIVTHLLGGNKDAVLRALSQAWLDGHSLRTYRHAPNTGSRKSWAAGDATSRGVRLALLTLKGEMGYPTALTTPQWGFYDSLFRGNTVRVTQPYTSYVIENILFKISYPAEFHAQTAVECAMQLHPLLQSRLDDIEKIVITTQESAMRIINKQGPLHNPADRDHCLQYMTAIGLLFGELTADHYQDDMAQDPRIDHLRNQMTVSEEKQFTQDYLDPQKRSIGNSVQVFFTDGTHTPKVTVEYPVGHRKRRAEGIPLLQQKFIDNLGNHYPDQRKEQIIQAFTDYDTLSGLTVSQLVELFIANKNKPE